MSIVSGVLDDHPTVEEVHYCRLEMKCGIIKSRVYIIRILGLVEEHPVGSARLNFCRRDYLIGRDVVKGKWCLRPVKRECPERWFLNPAKRFPESGDVIPESGEVCPLSGNLCPGVVNQGCFD